MAKRYGLVIDLERCIGCHTCTIACKLENGIENGSGIRVETVGGAHRDTPGGWRPRLRMHFLPVLCMHCDKPPCRDACPPGAIVKRDNGLVVILEADCNGCEACLRACPHGALFMDGGKGIVRKCDLCAHRIEDGLAPFCVVCCETEAVSFGDLADPSSPVSRLIRERGAAVLKPELGLGPAVYYIPTRDGRIS